MAIMSIMEFADWIRKKAEEWEKTGRSETQFAKELGIKQGTLNAMINKTRGKPRDYEIVVALIDYYKDIDPTIYDVLGIKRSSVDSIPPAFRSVFLEAMEELNSAASKKKIGVNSPEFEKLFLSLMSKRGWKVTTIDDDSI